MVVLPNRRTYPAFFRYILPVLWVGSCVLVGAIFSATPSENAEIKGMTAIFSMLCPFLCAATLILLLNVWFGKQVYSYSDGWLRTEKSLFGFHWGVFYYDLDLLEECRACFIDGKNLRNHEELERLRQAGAVICRKGARKGPEYVKPCWACRAVYDNQTLIFLAAPARLPVEELAEFMGAVMRLHAEKRD